MGNSNHYEDSRNEREERYLRDIIIQLSEISKELRANNRILNQVLDVLENNKTSTLVITLGTPVSQ
jgi:hypothetical protein